MNFKCKRFSLLHFLDRGYKMFKVVYNSCKYSSEILGGKKRMNETQQKPPYAMIAILFVGAFIAFLNNTLLNVALPSIMTDF